jgi:autoinducer 2-degrading protein
MRSLEYLALAAFAALGFAAPVHAQAPGDTAVYAVSYVDVAPAGRASMVAALKQYRDASRKDDGYVRFDVLEQVGWPGHFAVVEAWRDQKAFDAHAMAAHVKQFRESLQPIRLSGYDQRPYKTLTVASPAANSAQAVYIVAHVDIAGQGAQAEAPGLLRRLAEASRKEPGNVRFDVLQHVMRANHYTVVEAWQSQDAHAAHAAAAHTKEYRDVLQPITGSPLDERLYKAVE